MSAFEADCLGRHCYEAGAWRSGTSSTGSPSAPVGLNGAGQSLTRELAPFGLIQVNTDYRLLGNPKGFRGHRAVAYSRRKTEVPVAEDLSFKPDELPADRTLVIIDDDKAFLQRLGRAMEQRGFEVRMASSVAEGLEMIRQSAPAFAVVDLRLEDGSGLDIIAELGKARPTCRAIVLTGYGNFATAVSAVKLGAVDYLAKPADADEVTDALLAPHDEKAPPPENPMSADRVRWEHIQRVYELCNRNVSETARRLNMHRRTLQRILAKRAPK